MEKFKPRQTTAFFSLYRDDLKPMDLETDYVKNKLNRHDIPFYTGVSNFEGKKEEYFAAQLQDDRLLEIVRNIAQDYDQDSILVIGTNGDGYIHNLKRAGTEYIGQGYTLPSDQIVLDKSESYSLLPNGRVLFFQRF